MPRSTRFSALLVSTSLVASTTIGGIAGYFSGGVHSTTALTSSGGVTVTNDINVTGSPACINLDGKSKHCEIRAALNSTGGSAVVGNNRYVFRVQNTDSTTGVTGTGMITGLILSSSAPGENLTISCGTSTGSDPLSASSRTNLLFGSTLSTGSTVQRLTGAILVHANAWVICTNSVTHEKAAGLTGEATLKMIQVN